MNVCLTSEGWMYKENFTCWSYKILKEGIDYQYLPFFITYIAPEIAPIYLYSQEYSPLIALNCVPINWKIRDRNPARWLLRE